MKSTSQYDGVMIEKDGKPESLVHLPALPGTYALVLRISGRPEILVGRLGTLAVQPGFYVYVGSVFGPGGLAKRVGRHARANKTCRWHIDYLAAIAALDEVWYTVDKARRECQWAKALKQMRGATVPWEGFGSSDCRCRLHLFFFPKRPSLRAFRQRLVRSVRGHGPICTERPGERGQDRCS
jgi:Uri superfamily endonuclease